MAMQGVERCVSIAFFSLDERDLVIEYDGRRWSDGVGSGVPLLRPEEKMRQITPQTNGTRVERVTIFLFKTSDAIGVNSHTVRAVDLLTGRNWLVSQDQFCRQALLTVVQHRRGIDEEDEDSFTVDI